MVVKTWNVGVIGYGFSAKIFHIPFITAVPDLKLYAVVQRNPTAENDATRDFPGVKSYRSVEELLKDDEVDVVVVTTPPDGHYALAKASLEAGKHVVVEKPFVPTHKEAEELVVIAQKCNKLLAVYQMNGADQRKDRRYDADYVTLSKLVKNGSLGRVVEYETHFDRHRPEISTTSAAWKLKGVPETGAIYDLGAHLLDQAVHLFGLPQRITAFVGSQRVHNPTGLEDSFTALLHYDNGLLVTAKAGVVSPEEKQLRFWVRGDKGSFKKFHLDIQEDQLKAGLRPGDSGYGLEPSDRYGVLTTVGQDGKLSVETVPTVEGPTWVEYYRKLARALAGEGELPASGAEASQVIRLIELARESSKSGRTLQV